MRKILWTALMLVALTGCSEKKEAAWSTSINTYSNRTAQVAHAGGVESSLYLSWHAHHL